jgi:hypothetical protein
VPEHRAFSGFNIAEGSVEECRYYLILKRPAWAGVLRRVGKEMTGKHEVENVVVSHSNVAQDFPAHGINTPRQSHQTTARCRAAPSEEPPAMQPHRNRHSLSNHSSWDAGGFPRIGAGCLKADNYFFTVPR